ncbi:gamma-glutamyltransferase [Siccirubricoccus deserti]
MAREGGYLTMEDLAGYRSKLEPAVRREWRGHEVITCGPWCQGPALLEALLLMERGGISGMAHNSADYIHLFTESMKAAMADREYHFGDPAFIDVPLDRLLAEGHLAARLAEIDPARALPGMPGPILGSNLPPAPPGRSRRHAARRWSRPIPPTAASSTAGATPSAPRLPMARGFAGGAGARHHPLEPRQPEPARPEPPLRRRPRQAPAADAEPGDDRDP